MLTLANAIQYLKEDIMALTLNHLNQLAAGMPNIFDSHALIERAQTVFAIDFAESIVERRRANDPVRAAHSAIGRALLHVGSIQRMGKTYSLE